ncbi:hypothetical protein DHL47_04275 [Streptococcus panodentis]|uniref:Uncharacterized protein n=1 Tax=Streptococcus panodentis TaxID=1581472 RepID=A0ABS5AVG9_9STRE|nr:hypothetical protein [Streptococcus panodentis]
MRSHTRPGNLEIAEKESKKAPTSSSGTFEAAGTSKRKQAKHCDEAVTEASQFPFKHWFKTINRKSAFRLYRPALSVFAFRKADLSICIAGQALPTVFLPQFLLY